jgi:hypothetical protein
MDREIPSDTIRRRAWQPRNVTTCRARVVGFVDHDRALPHDTVDVNVAHAVVRPTGQHCPRRSRSIVDLHLWQQLVHGDWWLRISPFSRVRSLDHGRASHERAHRSLRDRHETGTRPPAPRVSSVTPEGSWS